MKTELRFPEKKRLTKYVKARSPRLEMIIAKKPGHGKLFSS
jgi:hypothetical protein